jgi:Leucine-rich repeat (LRR) protein
LDLRNNKLTALPESLGNLHALRFLDLRANQLLHLPPTLQGLMNLEKLDLRWNPLASPPSWIAELEARGCVVFV